MKIKKVIILVAVVGSITACCNSKKRENDDNIVFDKKDTIHMGATRFEELKGYFVKNTVEYKKDFMYIAVTNQKDFDANFGVAKTMHNKVTSLDFDKFNVAGILIAPTNKIEKIKLNKYTSDKDILIVEFELEKGSDKSFNSGAILLFKIPKSINSIDFIFNNQSEIIKVN